MSGLNHSSAKGTDEKSSRRFESFLFRYNMFNERGLPSRWKNSPLHLIQHKGMEKFITKEELRDIVSDLADCFMENKRYDVTIALSHYSSSDDLKITVQDRTKAYKVVSNMSFKIIGEPSDSFSIERKIKEDIKQYEAASSKAEELPVAAEEQPVEGAE